MTPPLNPPKADFFLHRFLILLLGLGFMCSCGTSGPLSEPTAVSSVAPQPQAQSGLGPVLPPALPPIPAAPSGRVEAEVLALVNEFRTTGTLNGNASVRVGTCAANFVPRPPLSSAAPLAAAAKAHDNYVGFNAYSGHSEVGGRPYFTGVGPAERLQAAHLPSAVADLWPHLTAWAETVASVFPQRRPLLRRGWPLPHTARH